MGYILAVLIVRSLWRNAHLSPEKRTLLWGSFHAHIRMNRRQNENQIYLKLTVVLRHNHLGQVMVIQDVRDVVRLYLLRRQI
jgi:hypothetical protein